MQQNVIEKRVKVIIITVSHSESVLKYKIYNQRSSVFANTAHVLRLAYTGFDKLNHPPYNPELAPSGERFDNKN